MASTEKARQMSDRLFDEMKLRCAPLAVVQSTGTAGDPVISVGPGTALGANAIVRVVPEPAPLAKDVLGLASNVYTPHRIQIVTEADFAGTTDNVVDPMTRQQLVNVVGPVINAGATVEWYESATGVAPTEAAIIAGNLKATFVQHAWNGALAGQ